MRSPICYLENEIARCPTLIAPEREERLAALQDKYQFEIELVDEAGFNIRVDLKEHCHKGRVITLPIAALEYLWVCAFHYWIINQEYSLTQSKSLLQFNLRGTDRLRLAEELSNWASQNLNKKGVDKWPDNLPSPIAARRNDTDALVANELFLCALAWMIHHEIAHAELQHGVAISGIGIYEEKQADLKASEWVLDGLECNDPKLKKRGLGVVTAILTLQSLEVNRVNNPNTHPSAHQRLHSCLSPYKIGCEEAIEAFAVVVLQVLFSDQGISPDIEGTSFSEILSQFLFDIARR